MGPAWQLALGMLSTDGSTNVTLDSISYPAGISACAKGQAWHIASGLLSAMARAKVERNSMSCIAAISPWRRDGSGYSHFIPSIRTSYSLQPAYDPWLRHLSNRHVREQRRVAAGIGKYSTKGAMIDVAVGSEVVTLLQGLVQLPVVAVIVLTARSANGCSLPTQTTGYDEIVALAAMPPTKPSHIVPVKMRVLGANLLHEIRGAKLRVLGTKLLHRYAAP